MYLYNVYNVHVLQLKEVSHIQVNRVDIITVSEASWLPISNPWDGVAPYANVPFMFHSDFAEYHVVRSGDCSRST